MPRKEATFDSVFTEEYWGDLLRMPKQPKQSGIRTAITKQSRSLVEQAANMLFRGDQVEYLLQGTTLSPESEHFGQGTVFLFDFETLIWLSRSQQARVSPPNTPNYLRANILDEPELQSSSRVLFRSNSKKRSTKNQPEQVVVYPYKKNIVGTEQNTVYGRMVGLATAVPDRKGRTAFGARFNWGDEIKSPIIGRPTNWRDLIMGLHQGVSIGDTYRLDKKRSKPEGVIRFNSIAVVTKGLLEASKTRSKRVPIYLGRRAVIPNLG